MSKQTDQSSIDTTIIPPLVFNRGFLERFIDSEPPCAALGMVEALGQQKGFLAIKVPETIEDSVTAEGFELGSQLLGNEEFAMLHLILNFSHRHVFDVVLNLGSPVTKRVMRAWNEQRDYFFFLFVGRDGFTNGAVKLRPSGRRYKVPGLLCTGSLLLDVLLDY